MKTIEIQTQCEQCLNTIEELSNMITETVWSDDKLDVQIRYRLAALSNGVTGAVVRFNDLMAMMDRAGQD
jgi:uncharacterized coiled-coil protein SlyX